MKIYTKTGDEGMTSLYTGERISKNSPSILAIGAVDECNCTIGLAISFLTQELSEVKKKLFTIQNALFDIGAHLATPQTKARDQKMEKTRFDHEAVEWLENQIDEMEENLPPLTQFILPGGSKAASFLHLARSICRRAETFVIPLFLASDVSASVMRYLNRLSDYLFVLSRFVNQSLSVKEIFWQKHQISSVATES